MRLNTVLPDSEPIPRIDMMFTKLTGCNFFSRFDFIKGYRQVPMANQTKELTAFSCESGLYHFKCMPFGIKCAVFYRLMRIVNEGIPNDDVLVGNDTWENHLKTPKRLFELIRAARLKPAKCEVDCRTTTTFLGHIVGGQGVLQTSITDIQMAMQPKTKKELKAFLGLSGYYYREFVLNYTELTFADGTCKERMPE